MGRKNLNETLSTITPTESSLPDRKKSTDLHSKSSPPKPKHVDQSAIASPQTKISPPGILKRRDSDPIPKPDKKHSLEKRRASIPLKTLHFPEDETLLEETRVFLKPSYSILIKQAKSWPEDIQERLQDSNYSKHQFQAFLKFEYETSCGKIKKTIHALEINTNEQGDEIACLPKNCLKGGFLNLTVFARDFNLEEGLYPFIPQERFLNLDGKEPISRGDEKKIQDAMSAKLDELEDKKIARRQRQCLRKGRRGGFVLETIGKEPEPQFVATFEKP